MKSYTKMTQEYKQLLLVDLSGRLTYGVICQVDDGAAGLNDGKLVEIDISKELARFDVDYWWNAYIDDIKPYLRPMSSMTEEEEMEYDATFATIKLADGHYDSTMTYKTFDFLNANHFDYRGLIPKGLALEAPKGMYKVEEQQ